MARLNPIGLKCAKAAGRSQIDPSEKGGSFDLQPLTASSPAPQALKLNFSAQNPLFLSSRHLVISFGIPDELSARRTERQRHIYIQLGLI